MHLQHHCKDSVMKQFKTQCYLMHETTTKAVRQRQLPFFLLANENNTPLSQGEKAKTQWPRWQVHQHRDSRGLETTCCQEPGQGTSEHRRAWPCQCACRAAQTSTSAEALPSGIDSRGKSLGVRRGSAAGRETAAARGPLLL